MRRIGSLNWRTKQSSNGRWTTNNWDQLRIKRGSLITRATREGCKRAWPKFCPLLPHEPRTFDQTHKIIVGLAGLQASLDDRDIQFERLNDSQVRIAVRYAINELNGFAPWLTDLAAQRPEIVRDVFSESVRGEWQYSAELQHPYAVMHDLVWHGNEIARLINDEVLTLPNISDPPNYWILRYALFLLLNQKNPSIEQIARIADQRLSQYSVGEPKWLLWMSKWLQVDANSAISALQAELGNNPKPDQMMVSLCSSLSGRYDEGLPQHPHQSYLAPTALRSLVPLVYRYVPPANDIDRSGTGIYSPEDRDDAQEFRSGLLSLE